MSSDLVWLMTRANSSFLVKRNGIQLSREQGNLLNKQSLKLSGVSSNKSVAISPAAKGVVLTIKKQSAPANKVKSSNVEIVLKGNTKQSAKKVVKILAKYRPDLTQAALARVSRIVQSQGTPKPVKAKKVRGVSKK